MSSTRLRNSGPEVLAQHAHDGFARHVEIVLGLERVAEQHAAPRFEVMMSTVFLKSTVRPLASVRRPSSITCNSMLKTSGCAFSISSKRMTA